MEQTKPQSGLKTEARARELIDALTQTPHSSSTPIVLANRDKALAQAILTISAAEHDTIAAVAKMFARLASSGVESISTEKAAELISQLLSEPDALS